MTTIIFLIWSFFSSWVLYCLTGEYRSSIAPPFISFSMAESRRLSCTGCLFGTPITAKTGDIDPCDCFLFNTWTLLLGLNNSYSSKSSSTSSMKLLPLSLSSTSPPPVFQEENFLLPDLLCFAIYGKAVGDLLSSRSFRSSKISWEFIFSNCDFKSNYCFWF